MDQRAPSLKTTSVRRPIVKETTLPIGQRPIPSSQFLSNLASLLGRARVSHETAFRVRGDGIYVLAQPFASEGRPGRFDLHLTICGEAGERFDLAPVHLSTVGQNRSVLKIGRHT